MAINIPLESLPVGPWTDAFNSVQSGVNSDLSLKMDVAAITVVDSSMYLDVDGSTWSWSIELV